ncbi:MAG TPA: GntR family transcriptional regulator [Candidatus Tectomicrobia bacterium]|nr:GntR family transcriptional regulator [Candidatus Tectomicrobia bacterium]
MNFRPGVPRYLQIADAIRREIKRDGDRIPSEHALCAQFKVSRPTVRQALDVLVQEGRVYRHAGRGTFATGVGAQDRRLRVIGSVGDMMALGEETWFKVVSRETMPAPANIAQALKVRPQSIAYRIVGVRHAETGPFHHATIWLPPAIGQALSEEDLSKTSLIGAIERVLNMPIKLMDQSVDAVLAPRHVAELLQVRSRSPLLLFERTYHAASGEPVEHAITYHVARRYPYRLVLARSDRRS